ncbi:MAG TPA: hypothetical protein PLE43_06955 [Alphaproteobacteria bacterium]|nr:hypothetical protein [Alphaproteobacteria bacterium]
MGFFRKIAEIVKGAKEARAIKNGEDAAENIAKSTKPKISSTEARVIADFKQTQRVLVEDLEAALNPRKRSLSEVAKDTATSVGNMRKGVMGNMSPTQTTQNEIATALGKLREHTGSKEYTKLALKEGKLSPAESLDALHQGYRISPENFRNMNKQLSTGSLKSSGFKTAVMIGSVALAAGTFYNGLESPADQNDNNLSFGERIIYNSKKFIMGATGGLGKERWVEEPLKQNPEDRIAKALQGNIKKNVAASDASEAAAADNERQKYTADARNAPAVDMSSTGLTSTAATKANGQTTGELIGANIRSLYQQGYLKEWEAKQVAIKWEDATKAPVKREEEFTAGNVASAEELATFKADMVNILQNREVGRSPEAATFVAEQVLKP